MALSDLPTGTVTFLFTDIEGSTRLLRLLGDRYADLLAAHQRMLRSALQQFGGREVDTQGDAFFIAFARARDAVAAAVEAQRLLNRHAWPEGASLRVRMGLHTGEPAAHGQQYVGIDVHEAARIAASGHGGQVLISETTCSLVRDDLPEGAGLRDLGRHRLKDLAAPVHIFQVVVPDLPDEFPALRSLEAWPNNLPVQLTSFVGREQDVVEIRRLLGTTHLLTLTGAGGSGKTRLGLQVAAEVLHDFSDGVWLVELAAVSDPPAILRAVAAVMGIRERHAQPLVDTLTSYLERKRVLLVMDNCEHLVEPCAHICAALLRACPDLRILATSRESLEVSGEVAYRVPTLAVPPSDFPPSLDRLSDYPAARLFRERARAALPAFGLTRTGAAAVADICRRLDGIPLAIEFAAARVKALSVEQIAERLDDRFRLLSGGIRTALPRHQTLRAVMDWSYDLLAEEERAVFRRLAVFAGGFTLEASEAVCAGGGEVRADVLAVLAHLVDKSLVVMEQGDAGARYHLLETVRQYAHEKATEAGEVEAVFRLHRDHFLALAERAEPVLHGPDQVFWLDRLEVEHDNLRGALHWSLDRASDDGGARLGGALWWYWAIRGHGPEGREWLDRILAVPAAGDVSLLLRIRALTGAGALASAGDDYGNAVAWLGEAVTLARQHGDRQALAVALALLGHALWHAGDPTAAVALAEESLAMSRDLGDAWAIARSSYDLAIVAWHVEDYARMEAIASEWLARSRATGDLWGTASALFFLGEAALQREDHPGAAAFFQERLALAQRMRDHYATAVAQVRLAHTALALGDAGRADDLFRQSLEPLRRLGDRWWLGFCLEGLAAVAAMSGRPERAATLLGAADALWAVLGSAPAGRPDYACAAEDARQALGEGGFHSARAQGGALGREEAIAYALEH